jgi:group I intron endonuclease
MSANIYPSVIHSIYQITNLVNNKIYIGKTKQLPRKRWSDHKTRSQNPHLKHSINKYGIDSFKFEVIVQTLSFTDCNYIETHLIKEYNTTNPSIGYNMRLGGDGGEHTPESRLRMSIAGKGKKKSESCKQNMRKPKSDEHRENISKGMSKCKRAKSKRYLVIDTFTNESQNLSILEFCEKYNKRLDCVRPRVSQNKPYKHWNFILV